MVAQAGEGDRALIEEAVALLLAHAPAGWTRVVAEFPVACPMRATAHAQCGTDRVPLRVPPDVITLIGEYLRRMRVIGRCLVVEVDSAGALSVRTDVDPVAGGVQAVGARPRRASKAVALWAAALVGSVAVLVVAIVGRDHGGGPTLRAMAVSEAISGDEAHAVAVNTVRGWVRERNAGHRANLEALSCPDSEGTVAAEIAAMKNGEPAGRDMQVVATGGFGRHGATWTLNTHLSDDVSVQFVLGVREGELRVCRIAAAPVP